jgi:hypothetical protein
MELIDGQSTLLINLYTKSGFTARKNRETWQKNHPNKSIFVERLTYLDGQLVDITVLD